MYLIILLFMSYISPNPKQAMISCAKHKETIFMTL